MTSKDMISEETLDRILDDIIEVLDKHSASTLQASIVVASLLAGRAASFYNLTLEESQALGEELLGSSMDIIDKHCE